MFPPHSHSLSDEPYTTADEDPFRVQPYIQPPQSIIIQRKRSSMLDKWINEQQGQPSEDDMSPTSVLSTPAHFESTCAYSSRSNPYLAYPDLPRMSSEHAKASEQDIESIISYDLIDDDDIPNDPNPLPQEILQEPSVSTSLPLRNHKAARNSITPAFRNLALSLRSQSAQDELPTQNNMESPSRVFSRLSLFPRTPRSSIGPSAVSPPLAKTPQPSHTRSSSLSTLGFSVTSSPSKKFSPTSSTSSKWRPSVLGHFQQPSISEVSVDVPEKQYAAPRPSISSADTYSSWNTSVTATSIDSNIPSTPSKTSLFESIRLRSTKSSTSPSNKGFSSSTLSLQSSVQCQHSSDVVDPRRPGKGIQQQTAFLSNHGSRLDNIDDDEDDLDDPPTYRFVQHPRAAIPRSSSMTFSRIKFSSLSARAHRKKKKLIVSGIGVSETRKFEGIKRWCESFGELRQVTRLPNGDLQFDFCDPEVADTVCRVRARVHIAGVGSVQLSWVSGTKR
ncbi:hypothetical protein CPC08DRAFT_128257 [Agrocybe pediades]|nr:hypothetical protein CPC08DRAFT_128257 [Agrocybe pediades]